jgi:aspartyl-tRNA(Asn)/glutamyl-tRNA(Gln) amidotransferase subunit C
MIFTKEQAESAARLARLRLLDGQLDRLAAQMGDILTYIETLSACDTSGVEPLYGPVEHEAPMREDVAQKLHERSDILAQAPGGDGQFFVVPKIVSG